MLLEGCQALLVLLARRARRQRPRPSDSARHTYSTDDQPTYAEVEQRRDDDFVAIAATWTPRGDCTD